MLTMGKQSIPGGMRLNFSRPDAKTILLIADQPVARSTLKRNLEYYKFDVKDAPTAVEGLKLYRDEHWDIGLVLLDLTRPELPLTKALQILHSIDAKVKVAICAATEPGPEQTGGLPLAGILRKPVRVDRLLSVVNKILSADPE